MTQKKSQKNKKTNGITSEKSFYKKDIVPFILEYEKLRDASPNKWIWYSEKTKAIKDHLFSIELISLKECDHLDENFLKYLVVCENIVDLLLRRIETLEKSVIGTQYDSKEVIQELIDDI